MATLICLAALVSHVTVFVSTTEDNWLSKQVDMQDKKFARDLKDFENFPDRSKEPQESFTWSEVEEYDGEEDRRLYIVYERGVYDITDFADCHPAGPEPLKKNAGRDASAAMRATNMPSAVYTQFINRFRVGEIVDEF